MPKARKFRYADYAAQVNGVAKGDCLFIPVVEEDISKTMGAGIDIFEEGCSYEWTVIYDELMFVLEGNFRLVVGDERFECEPGDILWIPNGTPSKYEADGHTVCFYVLYPVDWENPKVGPQDKA